MSRGADPRRAASRAVSILLVVSLIFCLGSVSSRASTSLTVTEFLAHLERARALAETGELNPSAEAMDGVRAACGLPATLVLPSGSVDLGPDAFLASLRGDDAHDFRLATQHLVMLADEVRSAEVIVEQDRDAVSRALADSYVGIAEAGPLERLWGLVWGFLRRVLGAAFEPLVNFQGFGSVLAWAVVFGIAISVVLLLRRLGVGLVPERAAGFDEVASSPLDWQRLAEEALRRNDLREAMRAFHHALVGRLAIRGILAGDPSTTAGECRAAVARAAPDLFASVAEATLAFERVAYGGAAPALTDVEAIRMANREAAA